MEKNIHSVLEKHPEYINLLFRRGFLLTSKEFEIENKFPFYNVWEKSLLDGFNLYVHNDQKKFIYQTDNKIFIMVGHAYNPWDGIKEETLILEKCAIAFTRSIENFTEEVSKITGVFTILVIDSGNVMAIQDSVGMMPIFYSACENDVYLSSHSQLIADLCGFKKNPKIEKLINASFYKIGIRHLPGIESPFSEIKALTANTYLTLYPFSVIRFYPTRAIDLYNPNEAVKIISDVLRKSMEICSEKMNASVSLTGGVDSQMTLAAGKKNYSKFKYFSFYSTDAEKKDAEAAHKICESLNLNHSIFKIPTNKKEINDYEIICAILEHNTAFVKVHAEPELRKIVYLINQDINVEIKSHIAEIGRGFYYNKLGIKKMPNPLKPRHMSNLYKRNMFDRESLKYMDESFDEFSETTSFGIGFPKNFDESDMFYWEHRMSQWAAHVKQDFDISHETTVIYNNRKLLEIFFSFKLKDRILDLPQAEITRDLNSELFSLNINNKNAMKNKKRIFLEKVFFRMNSIF